MPRAVLREVLISELHPDLDRSVKALPHDDHPSVLLVVGVNGTGKTTTVGKLARVLVADGRRRRARRRRHLPRRRRRPAADLGRPGRRRCGARRRGRRPAHRWRSTPSTRASTPAPTSSSSTPPGGLHTKTGLMDELGKVKRVVSQRAAVDEVLLVLDATIGQNGLAQARVFARRRRHHRCGADQARRHSQGRNRLSACSRNWACRSSSSDSARAPTISAPFEPAAFVDALARLTNGASNRAM